jgi:hypothetical protein
MSREEMRAVWVLQEFELSPPPFRYRAEWSPTADETTGEFESHDLAAAIAWARARAPRVLLRLCVGTGLGDAASFSAGEKWIDKFPAWRSAEPAAPSEEPRDPGYAGWAYVEEKPYEFLPLETFRLVDETQMVDGDRGVSHYSLERGLPLDEALRLARGRSEVVVIGDGWPGQYSYSNAGSRTYEPLPYPRFPF